MTGFSIDHYRSHCGSISPAMIGKYTLILLLNSLCMPSDGSESDDWSLTQHGGVCSDHDGEDDPMPPPSSEEDDWNLDLGEVDVSADDVNVTTLAEEAPQWHPAIDPGTAQPKPKGRPRKQVAPAPAFVSNEVVSYRPVSTKWPIVPQNVIQVLEGNYFDGGDIESRLTLVVEDVLNFSGLKKTHGAKLLAPLTHGHLFGLSKMPITSHTVRAASQSNKTRRQQMMNDLRLISTTEGLVHKSSNSKCCEYLYSFRMENLFLYMESVAYDDTQLMVRQKGTSTGLRTVPGLSLLGHHKALHDKVNGVVAVKNFSTPSQMVKLESTSSQSKILQTQLGTMVVVKLNSHQMVGVKLHRHGTLQHIENGTGKCIFEAQSRLADVSPVAAKCQHRLRNAMTDLHPSNTVSENATVIVRKNWRLQHGACRVHIKGRIIKYAFRLVPLETQGMRRTALAVNHGVELTLLRKCLAEEIRHRGIRVINGVPSAAARKHRRYCIAASCDHGELSPLRKVLMSLLPNGDWLAYKPEMYFLGEMNFSEEELIDMFVDGLLTALLGNNFTLFRTDKFTGLAAAINEQLLFGNCHGLGKPTFARYMARHGVDTDDALNPPRQGDSARLALGDARLTEERVINEEAKTAAPGETSIATDPVQAWRQENMLHRNVAWRFWVTEPSSILVLLRNIMEPVRLLMEAAMQMSGKTWEAHELNALLIDGVRHYRISETASSRQERGCIDRLKTLMSVPEMWVGMKPNSRSGTNRCLAFRMISKIICGVKELLMEMNDAFPTRLFLFLDAEGKDNMTWGGHLQCLCDDFSWDLITRVISEELTEEDAIAMLVAIAEDTLVDNVTVETLFASVRRWLHALSENVQQMSFEDLQASWTGQRARTYNADASARRTIRTKFSHPSPPQLVAKAKNMSKKDRHVRTTMVH